MKRGISKKRKKFNTAGLCILQFPARKVCWLEMNRMVKSEEPSPFPALTQIEVYGREAGETG